MSNLIGIPDLYFIKIWLNGDNLNGFTTKFPDAVISHEERTKRSFLYGLLVNYSVSDGLKVTHMPEVEHFSFVQKKDYDTFSKFNKLGLDNESLKYIMNIHRRYIDSYEVIVNIKRQ